MEGLVVMEQNVLNGKLNTYTAYVALWACISMLKSWTTSPRKSCKLKIIPQFCRTLA
jgi:hypothetical protein